MEKEQTEYLLRKLNQVFQDGYRPARGKESYFYSLKNNNRTLVSDMVNCFGHIFNLRNQQFDDYQIEPPLDKWKTHYYTGFFNDADTHQKRAALMLDFIRETGLKVTKCDPAEPVTDFKSWKMALYFNDFDFHCLLEDAPHQWSEKMGTTIRVNHHHFAIPPLLRTTDNCFFGVGYDLYNTYKITNPHADENNRYVKDGILGR